MEVEYYGRKLVGSKVLSSSPINIITLLLSHSSILLLHVVSFASYRTFCCCYLFFSKVFSHGFFATVFVLLVSWTCLT